MKNEFVLQPDSDIEFLTAAFPAIEFNLYRATVKEDAFLSTFTCWINSEAMLEQLWSRINNLIGAEYQVKLQDEFSSWNIYLAFFIPQQVSNALKYNIENETFFVRKIVVDGKLKHSEPLTIAKYLNDHILGKDIYTEQQSNQAMTNESEYTANTQSLLAAKLPLGRTENDKKMREAWLEQAILGIKST